MKRVLILIPTLFVMSVSAEMQTATSKSVEINAGKIHEECFKLQKNERVEFDFQSDIDLDFNIHYHIGKQVLFPLKKDEIREFRSTFTADSLQDYCMMWSNKKKSPVKVKYSYKRGQSS